MIEGVEKKVFWGLEIRVEMYGGEALLSVRFSIVKWIIWAISSQ